MGKLDNTASPPPPHFVGLLLPITCRDDELPNALTTGSCRRYRRNPGGKWRLACVRKPHAYTGTDIYVRANRDTRATDRHANVIEHTNSYPSTNINQDVNTHKHRGDDLQGIDKGGKPEKRTKTTDRNAN